VSWQVVLASKENAIGEITGVSGGVCEFLQYKPSVQIPPGTFVLIKSNSNVIVGIVAEVFHKPRLGAVEPLHRTRDEIEEDYPEIMKSYLRRVSTVVVVGYHDGDKFVQHRKLYPHIHDLVFEATDDFREEFFKAGGSWRFDFLPYFLAYYKEGDRANAYKDLLLSNSEFLKSKKGEVKEMLSCLLDVLVKHGYERNLSWMVNALVEVLR